MGSLITTSESEMDPTSTRNSHLCARCPTAPTPGFVVDMKGLAGRTGGHRHCAPAFVSEPPFLGDNSSHERCGPQSAPIGVEEHHNTSRRQTPC